MTTTTTKSTTTRTRIMRMTLCAVACSGLAGIAGAELRCPDCAKNPNAPQITNVALAGGIAIPALDTYVEPKELSENVHKGLNWLAKHQLESGAWGQGDESTQMGNSMQHLAAKGNVADTCAALMALLRSGSTPSTGTYMENIAKGIDYVCSEIEASDEESLSVTSVKGTRVQGKIGPFIDTFMSANLLAEVNGRMGFDEGNERVAAALAKVVRKMEAHQQEDGRFAGGAWAGALGQAMAGRGLNKAAQFGAPVSRQALENANEYAQDQMDDNGRFAGDDNAGIELYSAATASSGLREAKNTNDQRRDELEEVAADESAPAEERAPAQEELAEFDQVDRALAACNDALASRMDDEGFIAGFGSNGGEEFLSYLAISENLVVDGGEQWTKWDGAMTRNLNKVQNPDGSWTGHHCITGRTFCTSMALAVLMADRTPIPPEGETNVVDKPELDAPETDAPEGEPDAGAGIQPEEPIFFPIDGPLYEVPTPAATGPRR